MYGIYAYRDLKVHEVLARHTDVLEAWHQLTVEAAHGVAGEETRVARGQVIVDLAQMREQGIVLGLVLLHQHQLQLDVQVLDQRGHLLVLDEEIVPARDVLHDVAFDLLVLENGQPVVNEDGRVCGLEIGAEIGRRLLHVHCRHLQADSLQLGQQVQVHEVLLAEQTGALPPAIDGRGLQIETENTILLEIIGIG